MTADLAGTPAVAIITDRFTSIVEMMASALNVAGFPYALVAHPVSDNDPQTLKAKATEALRQSVEILTR